MSTENKNMPRLRFPGFTGEWVEKKLGDCFEFRQGVQCPVDLQSLQKKEGDIRFIRIIDLTQPGEPPRYIADPGFTHHISKNDLFMVRYGSPGLVGYGYEGVIANNLFRLLPKFDMCTKFCKYVLTNLQNEIVALSGASTMPAVNFTTLGLLRIVLPPSLAEQQKIAECLSILDDQIKAESAELDALKEHKKGLMQQLFPQQGETIPRLRFPSFTGEWVEKKLGEVCKSIRTGRLDANAMVEGGEYRFYTCAKDYSYIDSYEFEGDCIMIAGNGAHLGYVHHYNGKFNAYQRTYVLNNFTCESNYLEYCIRHFLPNRIALEKKEGNTPYIVLSTLTDMVLSFPSNPAEQQKIAECLTAIDDLIVVQGKKVDALKEHKKGLMQQLFLQPTK